PENVSKGHGLKWICDRHKIEYEATLGIGNDFNDWDMFEFVEFPFLLKNGVSNLKRIYQSVEATNNDSGFTSVVRRMSLI
ncbi:MAG TPA: HAD hydrolase family protein, partial [Prolixibacteraceae bacterium]|nr:HAD hydrolase family protein [Prolixibacteraceae bacterium]